MKKSFKTIIATALATAAMTITAVAGSYSYDTPFTIQGYDHVKVAKATFGKKSDHEMEVYFDKVKSAGDAAVGITVKGTFGITKSSASSTFYLKKGNYTGVVYNFEFDNLSKGTGHYGFNADTTTEYTVKSFNDSW